MWTCGKCWWKVMLRRFFRNSPLLVAAVFLMAAAPDPVLEKGKREPIVVTSDRMEADELGSTVTFIGDVTLKKENMTLTSDHLVVHYDAADKAVREIEAQGNVVVRQEGRVAQANNAVYYSKEEKIVLTGKPRIIENENQLGGERITMFMRSERSLVESGNVLFYQDKTIERKTQIPDVPLRRSK
jgi:lipopolysaccharide export system protein LptA